MFADAGWPTDDTLFTGNVRIRETVYSDDIAALTLIQDAADTEFPAVATIRVKQ